MFGHVVSDFAPAYSPDGTTIAFVRHVQVHGPDDDAVCQARAEPLARPAERRRPRSQITTLQPDDGPPRLERVWIPGPRISSSPTSTPAVAPSLGPVNSAAGNPTFLAGSRTQAITDYDVSPDGKKLVFRRSARAASRPS